MKHSQYITDCSSLVTACCGSIKPEFRLIAVDLAEFEDGFDSAHHFLSPAEQLQFQTYGFAKRQREWLGGRLACKQAVARLVGLEQLQHIVVANTEQGRPFASGPDGRQVHVSISHSGHFAMGLASYVPCGLDLQEVIPSLGRVQEKFIRPEEKEVLVGFTGSEREQQGLVWAVKEALRKQLDLWPLLGFLETRLQSIAGVNQGFVVHCCPVKDKRPLPHHLPVVYATMYNQYALALCFEPEPALEKEK